MIRHREGTKPDGSVQYRYELTEAELAAGFDVAFAPGPITGTFVLADGTEYECTPDGVAVKGIEHADELAWTIHKAHHARGNFLETPLPGDGSLAAYTAQRVAHTRTPDDDARDEASRARVAAAEAANTDTE
jgi:hypothetical protein